MYKTIKRDFTIIRQEETKIIIICTDIILYLENPRQITDTQFKIRKFSRAAC